MDTATFDEVQMPVRMMREGRQISLKVLLEDIQIKKKSTMKALLDSGCTRTCVDEAFIRS
jgi:hypothetical protein